MFWLIAIIAVSTDPGEKSLRAIYMASTELRGFSSVLLVYTNPVS